VGPDASAAQPVNTWDELLRVVARGDVDAFGRLYDLMAPEVYGLVRRVPAAVPGGR